MAYFVKSCRNGQTKFGGKAQTKTVMPEEREKGTQEEDEGKKLNKLQTSIFESHALQHVKCEKKLSHHRTLCESTTTSNNNINSSSDQKLSHSL